MRSLAYAALVVSTSVILVGCTGDPAVPEPTPAESEPRKQVVTERPTHVTAARPPQPMATPTPTSTATPAMAQTFLTTATPAPIPTSTPTPTPTPTPTATPAPVLAPTPTVQPTATVPALPVPLETQTVDDYIVWKVGDQVSPALETEAREAVLAAHDHAADLGMPRMDRPITIFLFRNLDTFAAEFKATTGREPTEGGVDSAILEGRRTTQSGETWVVISASAGRLSGEQVAELMFTAYMSAGSGIMIDAPYHAASPVGPVWLSAGSPKFLTWMALRKRDPNPCALYTLPTTYRSASADTLLSQAETPRGFYSSRDHGDMAILAVWLLAEQMGPEAIISYYASLSSGVAWQQAFQVAFGMTVENFYELFKKRRAAGFPRPRCPLLPPLVTLPDVPEYLKWEIGDGVSDEQLETIVRGIRVTHEFARAIGLPEPNDEYEIIVYVYNNIEKMVAAHGREVSWGVEERRRYWTGPATASAGTGKMFFGPGALQDSALIEMASHEFLHANYQQGVLGQRTTPSAFDRSDSMRVPRWLTEGMAVLLTQLVMSQYHDRPYPDFDSQENWMSRGAGTDLSLWDAELYPAQGHVDLISDETERKKKRVIVDCIYHCGVLAVELLASLVGIGKLSDYWMYLEPSMAPQVPEADLRRTGWVQAFERAYGITVEEFYELFEDHRAAGFPEVEMPLTLD